VIALDTNVLVYAHRRDSEWHGVAARAVAALANGAAPWAIPWPCLYEFFAIATHPRVYAPPSPPAIALAQIDAWLESPSLHLLSEGDAHWPALRGLLVRTQVAGPLVHDARVAALCLHHGVTELWSADRDFGRFAPLKVRNPLVRS
jgi:toxin-antitoxin system PIN domain toxin